MSCSTSRPRCSLIAPSSGVVAEDASDGWVAEEGLQSREALRASRRRLLRWRDTRQSRSQRDLSGAISRRYRRELRRGADPVPGPDQAHPGTPLQGPPSQGVEGSHGLPETAEGHPPAGVDAVLQRGPRKPCSLFCLLYQSRDVGKANWRRKGGGYLLIRVSSVGVSVMPTQHRAGDRGDPGMPPHLNIWGQSRVLENRQKIR